MRQGNYPRCFPSRNSNSRADGCLRNRATDHWLCDLGAAILPRLLEHRPLSFPIIYVTFGLLLFTVIPGTPSLNPVESSYVTERLTELVVIISLMGAGLKIDRPFSLKTWSAAWRLILIALPITAGVMAVLAWGIIGLLPATAILLGP